MLPPPPPGVTLPTQVGALQERSPNIPNPQPQKRKRADTAGSKTPTGQRDIPRLRAAVDAMDIEFLRDLVMTAATREVVIADDLLQRHEVILHRERTKIIDFSLLTHEVEAALYGNDDQSEPGQFESKYDAVKTIKNIITNKIAAHATRESSYGTKLSALKTLLNIGNIICEPATDTLTREVQGAFQTDCALEDAMMHCVETMPISARVELFRHVDSDGAFFKNLMDLQKEAEERCMFDGLDAVISLIRQDNGQIQGNGHSSSSNGPEEKDNEESGEEDKGKYEEHKVRLLLEAIEAEHEVMIHESLTC
jgi:hypothetical protein